ncbi:translation initiation factor 2 [Pseudomonas fluvialis]|jgi:septal ring factor EnvC (AmiA/AmiB activator)|uniref:translation initiation factor 2 n=1 Tax=Pseudomonas fluvialis TaxID=1793966 RepID=UPI00370CE692
MSPVRPLLLCLSLIAPVLQAEPFSLAATAPQSSPAESQLQEQLVAVRQQLQVGQAEHDELQKALQLARNELDAAQVQLQRLRQDNQRLKLKLQTLQSQQPAALLNEQQRWFALGAALVLLTLLLNRLLLSRSRSKHWLN